MIIVDIFVSLRQSTVGENQIEFPLWELLFYNEGSNDLVNIELFQI